MLTDFITKICNEYSQAITEPYRNHPLANYIRREAPSLIRQNIPTLYAGYKIEGSAGRGRWGGAPWVAIFNPDETEKASAGYFVGYGFPPNSHRVILGLTQSHAEARAQYGKESDQALTKQAELMRMKIPEFSAYFDSSSNVNYYTAGNRFGYVYQRVYDLNALPSESKLVEDLSLLLDAYETLFYRGGRDSDNIQAVESITTVQPISIEERYKRRVHSSIERPSSSKIQRIKKRLGFVCQACGFNFETTYGDLGREYIEAHHLVPISNLRNGEVRNTTEHDFAVLCSNCHRMIHRQTNPGDLNKLKSHIRN